MNDIFSSLSDRSIKKSKDMIRNFKDFVVIFFLMKLNMLIEENIENVNLLDIISVSLEVDDVF